MCGQQVDTADPAFPRSAGYWWFGCQSDRLPATGNSYGSLTHAGGDATGLTHSERKDEAHQSHKADVDDLIFDGGNDDDYDEYDDPGNYASWLCRMRNVLRRGGQCPPLQPVSRPSSYYVPRASYDPFNYRDSYGR